MYFCEFVKRCAITRLRERAARSGDLVLSSTGTTANNMLYFLFLKDDSLNFKFAVSNRGRDAVVRFRPRPLPPPVLPFLPSPVIVVRPNSAGFEGENRDGR